MEKLSAEILCEIFDNLDLDDLLICRSVKREWNSIIKNRIRIKSLCICKSLDSFEKDCKLSSKHTESTSLFLTSNLNLFSCSFKSILTNLKKLFIVSVYKFDGSLFSFFNLINQFIELEQLGIDYLPIKRNGVLNLPNLKCLFIDQHSNLYRIRLSTPKLKTINLTNIECFDFDYPGSINHLIGYKFKPFVLKFVNLKWYDLACLEHIPVNIRRLLPDLVQINWLPTKSEKVKKSVISNILWGFYFEFCICDLIIKSKNDLDNLDAIDGYLVSINKIQYFKMILDNYSKLTEFVQFLTKVHFNTLVDFFNEKIDPKFFNKFMNVRKLVVNSPFDKVQLINFMKHYVLDNLRFINCSLDQEFLNQLPNQQKKLSKFKIQNIDQDQLFDFSFISEFKYLRTFKTNLRVPCSLISAELYLKEHFVKVEFYFKFNNLDVQIHYIKNGPKKLTVSGKIISFESYDEIVDFLDKLKHFDSLYSEYLLFL